METIKEEKVEIIKWKKKEEINKEDVIFSITNQRQFKSQFANSIR